MAFEEIKAKLGLDITDYERALVRSVEQAKQAQKDINAARLAQARETNRSITADQNKPAKSARESASVFEQAMAAEEEAKKKTLQNEQEIADTKQRNIEQEERRRLKSTDTLARAGKTIAAALGLNIKDISESIARFVVGFSKAQEDALKRLVQSSREAADQLSGIALERQGVNDPEKRIKLLDRELASVRLQAQARTKLTAAEKYAILAREGPITADAKIASIEESMAMGVEEANKRIGQISRERLIAEGELKKNNSDKEKKDIEEIGKSFEASADERQKRKFNELSIDGKIASKQVDLANAQKVANDETKDAVQRAQALAKSQQLQSEIIDLQSERTKGIADAEKKLTEARRKNALGAASDAQKLSILNQGVADAQKAIVDAGSDQVKQAEARIKLAGAEADLTEEKDRQSNQNSERIKGLIEDVSAAELKVLDAGDDQNAAARAQIELQKARKKLSEEQAKITEKTAGYSETVNDAENKRAKATAEKIDSLFGRAATLEKTLAEAKQKAELPTMAEVVSGKRNIGGTAKNQAIQLERARAKELQLADAEQRAKEAYATAPNQSAKAAELSNLQDVQSRLEETRSKIKDLEDQLGSKISDANPFADQEKAAKDARDAADKAANNAKNQNLVVPPQEIIPSKPVVAPQAIVPPQAVVPPQAGSLLSSAMESLNNVQNQMKPQALAAKAPLTDSRDISGILNSINKGITDLNTKLQAQSVK